MQLEAPSLPTRQPRPRGVRVERTIAFGGAAALVLMYALRGGGSYDPVSFEEQGLLIWGVLACGIALGLLPRSRSPRAAWPLLGALAAYAGWTALSLLWTQSSELTSVELARALDYLGLVVLAGAVLTRDSWRAAIAGLGFGALCVCVVALGSRLDPGLLGRDSVAGFLHSDRLSRPFGYWNAVAAWGAMCTALALTWSAHDSVRLRRALALALVPVAVTTTYLTYSRAGVAGTALAVIAALALSRNRLTVAIHAAVAAAGSALAIAAVRNSTQIVHATGTRGAGMVFSALVLAGVSCAGAALLTRGIGADRFRLPARARRPLLAILALVVIVPAAAVGPHLASRAWHSFSRTPGGTLTPAADPTLRLSSLQSSRYVVWKSAIKAFDAHPLDGTGAGTFEYWWNQHGTTGEFVRDAHNIWLENLAELGLPGLLLIIGVAASAVSLALGVRVRARRGASVGAAAAVLAMLVVYLLHATVDWMWESTAVTVLALASIGALSARLSYGRLRLPLPARAPLALLAAGVAVFQVPGILSSSDIRHSQAAARAGDTVNALALAGDAVSAEPWSASAHEQQALVLESTGQLRRARHQESIAVSDEPDNYVHFLIRSRIETELGQLRPAVRDYRQAYHLRPHASVFALAPYYR